MLHTNSIEIDLIKKEQRLNPKYFRFYKKRKDLLSNSDFQFYKLGDKFVSRLVTDGEHQAISLYDEGKAHADIRYLYVHNIKTGNIDLVDSNYIAIEDHKRLNRCKLNKGNVLLTIVGNIGNSAMVYDYLGEANIPRNISKIVVNEKNILPEFLTVFLLSKFGREQSYYTSGGNIQGLLSLTKAKSMYIPVPKINVQNEIGALYIKALECENKALKLIHDAQKELLKNLSFNFKDIKNPKTYQVKYSKILDSDSWCQANFNPYYIGIEDAIKHNGDFIDLGTILDIQKGDEIGSKNYIEPRDAHNNVIPFIRTSNFINYEIDNYPDTLVEDFFLESTKQDVKTGDILYTKDGKIGQVAMVTNEDKFIFCSGINRLRLNEIALEKYNLTPEYLFTVLSIKELGVYQALRYTVIAATIPHLKDNRFNRIIIPVINKKNIENITHLVKDSFNYKTQKKQYIKESIEKMNKLLDY